MGKNVAVFVDVANIFYAAKAAGVDIDYVTLLKAGSAGRDLVRAYAYTGLDPDNENQRNFHDFLRRSGYKVVSKDIRKYGDGKVKANLDIELVVDMMKTARNLDVAIVVSGDGDFAPAIRAVQEMGVRVEVVSFRGNTSSDLMDVADLFTDIVQIAKVEKGSSRSGRRVAADDDLSMTEVPDKMTEGIGERTRGGRGRTRRPASDTGSTTVVRRGRTAPTPLTEPGEGGAIVVLPGEKLSRAAAARIAAAAAPPSELDLDEAEELVDLEGVEAHEGDAEALDPDVPRRRRRRGGRGRGRSRGRDENGYAEAPVAGEAGGSAAGEGEESHEDEERPVPARRVASAFGSVWDSQIGVPAARSTSLPAADDQDFEEPSVPEYLLTERRQRDAERGGFRGGGGGRGRGGAYAAALDRERFGGGRGSTPSRFAEPSRSREGFGRGDRNELPRRDDRGVRNDRQGYRPAPSGPRPTSDEPWSEVPPEIEAMLRAQQGSRARAPRPSVEVRTATPAQAPGVEAAATEAPARRGRRTAAAPEATEAPAEAATARRTPARRTRATATDTPSVELAPAAPTATRSRSTRAKAADTDAAPAAPVKRTSRSKAPTTGGEAAESTGTDGTAAPKRRTTRKKAEAAG